MTNDGALGQWYCELVEQEQSEEEAERYGEYDDFDRPPQKAAKTEFAGTTLTLEGDGRYRMHSQDWTSSHGTWTGQGGGLVLVEAEDSSNGFDGLEYSYLREGRLVVAFKLIPDSHDGLDVLVLSFGRTPPAAKGPKPESFVDQVLALDDEDALYDLLDELEELEENAGDAAARERELWDAWVAGRLLVDPERSEIQLQLLDEDRFRDAGGFNHAHAKHGLMTVDYDEQRDLFDTIINRIAALPVDEAADAELAPLITGAWFERVVGYRFLGGGLPEELYARRLVPQPAVDDACRAYLMRGYYTRFEAIPGLFPPGHADAAAVAIRYRGRGLLEIPLAFIDERGLADAALAAALELLAGPEAERSMELWLSAMLFAVVLSIRAGQPIPALVSENLATDRKGMVMGGLSDAEKDQLRGLIEALPEDQRALVVARYWLAPRES